MQISPDQNVFWQIGPLALNATIVFTWAVMALLVVISGLVTRRLTTGPEASRWQLALEVIVDQIRGQIHDASQEDPDPYVPFIGTLFLFIVASALVGVIPGVVPPTASLSTTAALAIAVFVAVPAYGVAKAGVGGYLRHYVQPTPFMLPFHVVSELSRTLALAVRLFGNMMSGTLIVAILVSVVPFLFPVVMELFGLLIGLIQAYVFAVLSLVYIASATRSHRQEEGGGAKDRREQADGEDAEAEARAEREEEDDPGEVREEHEKESAREGREKHQAREREEPDTREKPEAPPSEQRAGDQTDEDRHTSQTRGERSHGTG